MTDLDARITHMKNRMNDFEEKLEARVATVCVINDYVILTNVYLIPTFYITSFMITVLLLNNSFNELQIITVKYLLFLVNTFSWISLVTKSTNLRIKRNIMGFFFFLINNIISLYCYFYFILFFYLFIFLKIHEYVFSDQTTKIRIHEFQDISQYVWYYLENAVSFTYNIYNTILKYVCAIFLLKLNSDGCCTTFGTFYPLCRIWFMCITCAIWYFSRIINIFNDN